MARVFNITERVAFGLLLATIASLLAIVLWGQL
jgi:hypothetical protein